MANYETINQAKEALIAARTAEQLARDQYDDYNQQLIEVKIEIKATQATISLDALQKLLSKKQALETMLAAKDGARRTAQNDISSVKGDLEYLQRKERELESAIDSKRQYLSETGMLAYREREAQHTIKALEAERKQEEIFLKNGIIMLEALRA